MLYGQNRLEHRQYFYDVWKKMQANEPLDAFEARIAEIIQEHPEYHYVFKNPEKYQDKDFSAEAGETNPFFHFSLHIAVRDQIATNNPPEIQALYPQLIKAFGTTMEAEHCMMHSLAIELYEMQQSQHDFDNHAYIERIRKAIKDGFW